ncbi:hypothetical protein [Nonomuraea sp. NPDC050786]|uniref:arsenate reductase/protein-tyrosine-phosphatase family protein n=1 Tax=Nonomuraea sp. NPDC050786 TaxID=3154840 RepID=UPI0033CF69F2
MTSGEARFHILFVCTGNMCRSPLAERLTRSVLGPPFLVTSAGTHAEPGVAMAERARQVLIRLGGDPTGFVSQPLTAKLLAGADLVLTAAREHRAQAVTTHLQAAPRVFTMVEFGALAAAAEREEITRHRDAVRRAHALVEQAQALRGLVKVDRPDIPDPMGRWSWAHKAAGRRIAKALSVPLELLTQPSSS